eukprot:m.213036 g.213036  ORF g.213036 m.213036 type:complete len:282 (+) comp26348_c0_seq1:279-1124(+)
MAAGAATRGGCRDIVHINSDVYFGCLAHAFSTEREEVMGLLIGVPTQSEAGDRVVEICNLIILSRSDKRKDRCEISSEQLVSATETAERLAAATGRPLRVVGWYHSHPHITVWPSHVDLRTQAQWQVMEPTFIGLIFSCFNDAPDGVCRVEMTSFRTAADGTRIEVPVAVDAANVHSRSTLAALSAIPQIFFTEEETLFRQAQAVKHGEPLISVHNGAVYTAAVCRLLDQVCAPLVNTLHTRLARNHRLISRLEAELAATQHGNPFLEKTDGANATEPMHE